MRISILSLITVLLLIPATTEARPSKRSAIEAGTKAAVREGVTKEELKAMNAGKDFETVLGGKERSKIKAPMSAGKSYAKGKEPKVTPLASKKQYKYASPLLGISVTVPDNLPIGTEKSTVNKSSFTLGNIRFGAESAAEMTMAQMDARFTELSTLKSENSISDWYIPSIANVQKSDVKMFKLPARKYTYTSIREGKEHTGVWYMGYGNARVYDITFGTTTNLFPLAAPQLEEIVQSMQLLK